MGAKNRQNRPEIDPHKYVQLIFSQRHKDNSMKKGQSCQQIVPEQLAIFIQKKNLHIGLTSYIKLNSKWDIDLTVKYETIKLL